MCFKEVYQKVDVLKDFCIQSILEEMEIDCFYADAVPFGKQAVYTNHLIPTITLSKDLTEQEERIAVLHEIGHALFDRGNRLSNKQIEENNANLFMCLYLIHNEIWDSCFFDSYLISQGVKPKIARQFNDRVWQYKNQVKLELSY